MEDTYQTYVGGVDFNRGFKLVFEEAGCSEQFDTRFVGVYGETEENMYDAVTPAIPLEYITSNPSYRWYLSYKHETQWASAANGCSVTREQMQSNAQEVQKLRNAQEALIILTVFSFIFLGIVGTYVTIKILVHDNDGKIQKGEEGYTTMCGLKIANYVMKVANYICVIVSIVLAYGMFAFFVQLTVSTTEGSSCTDTLSQSSFNGLASIVEGLSKKNLVQGFTNFFDLVAEVAHQALHCIM